MNINKVFDPKECNPGDLIYDGKLFKNIDNYIKI